MRIMCTNFHFTCDQTHSGWPPCNYLNSNFVTPIPISPPHFVKCWIARWYAVLWMVSSLPAQQSELTVRLGPMCLLVLSSLPMATIALCVSVIIASVTVVMSNNLLSLHHFSCLFYINWWALSFPLHISLQTWCTKTNIYTVEWVETGPAVCRERVELLMELFREVIWEVILAYCPWHNFSNCILPHRAVELCMHLLYLMIMATVSAPYAFMVPVATPPNAIAFSYGYLKV